MIERTRPEIGLIIGRFQPFHNGHFDIIKQMLSDCDTVIIGVGSAQFNTDENRTINNPYITKERIGFITKVFGKSDKIKIVKLKDIGAKIPKDWIEYVLKTIEDLKLPRPTRYYCGSDTDALWIKEYNYFHEEDETPIINCYLMDRRETKFMTGTEIRKGISNCNLDMLFDEQLHVSVDDWTDHIPECIFEDVVNLFPKKLQLYEIIKNKEEKINNE